eukprot:gene14798-1457_t
MVQWINGKLQAAGFVAYYARDQQLDSALTAQQVLTAIDCSIVFVPCITQSYLLNAAGKGQHGTTGCCYSAFKHAIAAKGTSACVPVVLEASCRDPRHWRGPVAMSLGSNLYADFVEDSLRGMDCLQKEIRRIARNIMGCASQGPEHPLEAACEGDKQHGVTVNLTRQSFEAWVPWGLKFRGSMELYGCAVGSAAAGSTSVRGCIGMILTHVNGTQIHGAAHAYQMLEHGTGESAGVDGLQPEAGGCTSTELRFREKNAEPDPTAGAPGLPARSAATAAAAPGRQMEYW